MTEARDNLFHAGRLAGDLPGLLLRAQKVAHTVMKGVHGRRRTGMGEAFWQFRPYVPGDTRRDIDWKQSAKRDAPYVRQTEWEASQTLWLYRDGTESMNYHSVPRLQTKKNYAEVLLLSLSMLALNGGEQVSLLGTDLAPQAHEQAVRRIYDTLPRQAQLAETGRPVAARSQVVIFSDFYFPPEELADFCGRLALRGVQGALVQVFDPAERSLPYQGRVKFQDMENAAASLTIPQVEAVRALYEEKFAGHREQLAAAAKGWGWEFLAVSTDTPEEKALSDLYDRLAVA